MKLMMRTTVMASKVGRSKREANVVDVDLSDDLAEE
jgi:hypothetical protein